MNEEWIKMANGCLQGVAGACKTTLLDVLANHPMMSIFNSQILVDGRLRDTVFQRKNGHVQQQDLHLAPSTVQENNLASFFLNWLTIFQEGYYT